MGVPVGDGYGCRERGRKITGGGSKSKRMVVKPDGNGVGRGVGKPLSRSPAPVGLSSCRLGEAMKDVKFVFTQMCYKLCPWPTVTKKEQRIRQQIETSSKVRYFVWCKAELDGKEK